MADNRETLCKNVFDRFLYQQCGIFDRTWERVAQGEDPPDFYLTVEGKPFAVEITSTEVLRDVHIGLGGVREQTYESSCISLLEQLEKSAILDGMLNGVYIVDFDKPFTTNKQFTKARKVISQELLNFIQETKQLDKSPFKSIIFQGSRVCRIGKFTKKPNKVYYSFTDVSWEDSAENSNKICRMLQYAIDRKTKKLETKCETAPKILLLLNTYAFATQKSFKNCLPRITGLKFFHTIYIIWYDGSGFPLSTRNDIWTRVGKSRNIRSET